MADVRREAHRGRYVSFNLMTDTRGNVVDIEEAFSNLPQRIFLLKQYMNESIITEDWGEVSSGCTSL